MKSLIHATVFPFVTGWLVCFSGLSLAESVEEKYQRSCHVCHATGVANAPKVHDPEAWKPRLDKGMDVLVNSIKNGLNAMPPGGLCADCSDEDYKALIKFMSTPKK
ncbi:c-type cytochrome [Microbulbifer hydrolyticus]|uniref:Cytochrome c5 n=1 Tax=Microbulbifer hydrolyticus TaxID=48074 RepID=A0A6P1T9F2_9GAMM|nr:c-type cytochrome [Microbulbifer hydrolyticus]MBB5212843.1 cytochrome c5 [Microbulbifer hydrolyticus]QHQ38365.1 cytochrome c5 family protein [Microbulbifer hydrolyticus]